MVLRTTNILKTIKNTDTLLYVSTSSHKDGNFFRVRFYRMRATRNELEGGGRTCIQTSVSGTFEKADEKKGKKLLAAEHRTPLLFVIRANTRAKNGSGARSEQSARFAFSSDQPNPVAVTVRTSF